MIENSYFSITISFLYSQSLSPPGQLSLSSELSFLKHRFDHVILLLNYSLLLGEKIYGPRSALQRCRCNVYNCSIFVSPPAPCAHMLMARARAFLLQYVRKMLKCAKAQVTDHLNQMDKYIHSNKFC